MEITLTPEYGYVLLVALASTFINQWHGIVVTGARMKAKVPYPNAYALHAESPTGSDKYTFNCTQRAHQNYLENLPNLYVPMFISGLVYPKFAAGAGAVYLFGRILYAIGYKNPKKETGKGRYLGAPVFYPAQLGLWGAAGYVCYSLIFSA
ncbi:hypothetical protein TWF106_004494 [Orbilia oligospora]|uniref:Microsomal glutathione S-transferase 3 n=1 Tax=Orbilia oligospora TaxID=2813651 RepID=A0A6G1MIT6_ORBOL|nr:hypothetical protein TWF788_007515 [Orbilia oligospora]KAF3178070.1 hypothetical protein TWF788_007515 [Orbilia oligospora]KAF3196931.1 hypothetical protein TWF679_003859 [Orbilia oligospora]KAF3198685.1 hypothetical protein TWF106_004494 [Orbilia oligospora]KAF3203146.1 hypothetical protein TWF191_002698 [Orbilia oligospora]